MYPSSFILTTKNKNVDTQLIHIMTYTWELLCIVMTHVEMCIIIFLGSRFSLCKKVFLEIIALIVFVSGFIFSKSRPKKESENTRTFYYTIIVIPRNVLT